MNTVPAPHQSSDAGTEAVSQRLSSDTTQARAQVSEDSENVVPQDIPGIQHHISTSQTSLHQSQPQSKPSTKQYKPIPDFQEEKSPLALAAHDNARSIVRLIQCPHCSRPFEAPVTLPCGRSICRACLPESHERERITWPDLPDRRRAIQCPFEACGEEHTMADCSIDVVLYKIMEAITFVVARESSLQHLAEPELVGMEDTVNMKADSPQPTRSRGRLVAIYQSAASGHLLYTADAKLHSFSEDSEDDRNYDEAVLSNLLDVSQKELDCQVCYNLMLDPVTTSCGHTLCRKCLVRSLDHSRHCPVCRRMILMQPSLSSHPSNKTLGDLLNGLCPEIVLARKDH